jgi:CRISPR type III-B/RAMP module RAMP protein Cmr6
MKKAIQENRGKNIFFVEKDRIILNNKILKDNNLSENSLNEPGVFYIDYKKENNGNIKINSVHKDIFRAEEDNFCIRFYKSSIYRNYLEPKSQLLKVIQKPNYAKVPIIDLCLRQLLHSLTVCDGIPFRFEFGANKNIQSVNDENYTGKREYSTKWRLAIGLGGSSVFENGMTLHHIYGFPYIPASSVKGILRSWIICTYFQKNDNKKSDLINAEYEALGNEVFCLIFGCSKEREITLFDEKEMPLLNKKGKYKTENKPSALIKDHIGNIVFFDAYPTSEKINVEVDVMTPHYQPYYDNKEGTKPPADYYSPVPIFFLTVKDTSFQFLFGLRKGIVANELDVLQNKNLLFCGKEGDIISILSQLLTEALTHHGIGAKTAVGYGRMAQT